MKNGYYRCVNMKNNYLKFKKDWRKMLSMIAKLKRTKTFIINQIKFKKIKLC